MMTMMMMMMMVTLLPMGRSRFFLGGDRVGEGGGTPLIVPGTCLDTYDPPIYDITSGSRVAALF